MKLRDLADIDSDLDVTGFAIDHRKVERGSIFGAFKGAVFNGEVQCSSRCLTPRAGLSRS